MSVDTLHELFVHNLEDMYYAETELIDALDELAEQTEKSEISEAFREHGKETEGHVSRLEAVFELIGEEPETEECEGIEGLIKDYETFVAVEDPAERVLDLHNLISG
jgi:ferritin-like metal-binding protein YciE